MLREPQAPQSPEPLPEGLPAALPLGLPVQRLLVLGQGPLGQGPGLEQGQGLAGPRPELLQGAPVCRRLWRAAP